MIPVQITYHLDGSVTVVSLQDKTLIMPTFKPFTTNNMFALLVFLQAQRCVIKIIVHEVSYVVQVATFKY